MGTTEVEKHDPNILTSLRVSLKEKEQAKKKICQAHRQGRINDDEFVTRLNSCDGALHQKNLQYLHADLPPVNKHARKWWGYAAIVAAEIIIVGMVIGVIAEYANNAIGDSVIVVAILLGILSMVATGSRWLAWYDDENTT